MTIQIKGFSPLQRDLADRIWSIDTQQELTEFVAALPQSLKREAWVVISMILAAEFDDQPEILPETLEILDRIKS